MANAGRVAIVPKGDYSSSTAYKRLDLVRYNEKAYVAKKANTGILPTNTEYWMLMTSDGITIDTTLSETSTNPVQNKVVKTALDNIQTTSRATLSTAGWYRVAEYNALSTAQANGGYANSCEISIKEQSYGSVKIRLDSHKNSQEFVLLSADYNIRIPKIRYTVTTDYKAYIEIYLSDATSIIYSVVEPQDYAHTWKTISAVATSETVDGVTVTTTYDIPANASPVTDLDLNAKLEAHYYPYKGDFSTEESANAYLDDMGYASGRIYKCRVAFGFSHSYLGGGELVIEGFKLNNSYEWQVATSYWNKRLYRAKQGGTWTAWKTFATTADLANYLPIVNGEALFQKANEAVAYTLDNGIHKGSFMSDRNGNLGIWDDMAKGWLLLSAAGGDKYFYGTATGNLPLTGGAVNGYVEIKHWADTPFVVNNISDSGTSCYTGYNANGIELGYIGFRNGVAYAMGTQSSGAIHHDGNSAKVAIQESAPFDTTALWVDTANNKVKAYVDGAWEVVSEDRSANAASHNTIHGGRDITSLFDNGTFSTQVANGTFTNIYPGDYITKTITYNDTSYTITGIVADLDYHYAYASGYSTIGEHHVAMVFTGLPTAPMNETDTTEGGYAGSLMHTTTLPAMLEAIKEAFGEEHIITHKKLLTNAVGTSLYNKFGAATGASSGLTWQDSAISLMSEAQVYGTTVWSSSGYDTGEANRQLSIFKLKNFNEVLGWRWLWLRDVASSSHFCDAGNDGYADYDHASDAHLVCPLILLK